MAIKKAKKKAKATATAAAKGATKRKRGRPRKIKESVKTTSQAGTREGETRATFIVSEKQLEAIKALAYFKRDSIKEMLHRAFSALLDSNKRNMKKAFKLYEAKGTEEARCEHCNSEIK